VACGDDYSITEYKTLDEAVEYHKDDPTFPANSKFIYAHEIKFEEKIADVPEQGYVWRD
jgi:hypothetical protein